MAKTNLSEAAKDILSASVASKRGSGDKPSKLSADVAYGTKDAGMIGQSPEMSTQDNELPNYTKGVPTATPPGATPPVGSEPMKHEPTQPQETQGRKDLQIPVKADATDYESIRDRKAGKLAPQKMSKNPGSTFASYGEELDMSADVDALLEGENLSEEFKNKATTIFEAAVISRAESVVAQVESELLEQFDSALEEIKEDLASKVDDYLNYMVEEWMEENKLAIESGLKAELVEGFLTGLHNLFLEHNIDVPADKVDIVEELAEKVAELEAELNEQIYTTIELNKELNEQKKLEAIYTACEGLTQTQVEKLKSLAESIEFTTEEEFAEKIDVLKESYFKTEITYANTLDEEVDIEEEKKTPRVGSDNSLIEAYAKTITQTLSK
ncbi:prohead core protein [uncultured Caudovirales phage]|uniref:Prohead core protein n=1 Tax=uncultured Caudovirales phage TaxID=2100421 RepID=A0A6J5LK08_9CAUD|nr:prohead core protein [uncultured Caudovirales phage]